MKKKNEQPCPQSPCDPIPENTCECQKVEQKKPDVETKIYNFLNTAEVIAVKLAQINMILKKAKKKRKKKVKKLGKVDKKTGTLILKGQKPQKAAKAHKRYKPKKK